MRRPSSDARAKEDLVTTRVATGRSQFSRSRGGSDSKKCNDAVRTMLCPGRPTADVAAFRPGQTAQSDTTAKLST
jgi:hypothetical protein